MSKIRVAVIFGGMSNEHDVSLVSATSVISNIPKDKYDVICIGITKKGRWLFYPGDIEQIATGEWEHHPDCASAVISPDTAHKGIIKILDDGESSIGKIDCIFPVLHGKYGEDGTIQGLFALSGIPFVGCDTLSSAVCMDKAMTHTILDFNGIKTAKWKSIARKQLSNLAKVCEEIEGEIKYPVFVKPANCGSSIGISKASNREELEAAIKFAFTHDAKVVIEQSIIGREIECAVLGNDNPIVSTPGEIVPCNEFYDYDAKYVLSKTELKIPAPITDEQKEKICETAKNAYMALGCNGLSRVDCFLKEDGEVIVNEVNTLPGFTSISMYPKLMEFEGISYEELIDRLITLAMDR